VVSISCCTFKRSIYIAHGVGWSAIAMYAILDIGFRTRKCNEEDGKESVGRLCFGVLRSCSTYEAMK